MFNMEVYNRNTFENPLEIRQYNKLSGYINNGEEVTIKAALRHNPEPRILDIGVGGGRTTPILHPHAKEYLGVDYAPAMVDLARRKQPYADYKVMDARDLSEFPDAHFDLVVFSFNGIDSVNKESRIQVLKEISRVLAPNGVFLFSTMNMNWEGYNSRRPLIELTWTGNPVRMVARLALALAGFFKRQYLIRFEETDQDHALKIHPAHHFGVMYHTVTPKKIKSELLESGLQGAVKLFSKDGPELTGDYYDKEEYFQVIAFKKAGADMGDVSSTPTMVQAPEYS
ncbi:MAG: hypothetical protein RIR97_739 [Pseudomonadota bacterium]|jgi:ubiquinone/menaquinone biosynthesis C-methylase UbiE